MTREEANNGINFTVKDLRDMLDSEADDALLFAIYNDENGVFCERPIYKTATEANDKEQYLYLGDKIDTKK